MPIAPSTPLAPRKSPVQARSTASVDALLEATVQVLREVGPDAIKERLTTTRVAARAGVSVGTLYQYFPNKSALLQAAIRHHLDDVTEAVERVCREQAAQPLSHMAAALITTFLAAKMRDPGTSVALYAVSADLDAARIAREMGDRCRRAIAAMLETAPEPLTNDPQLVASVLQSTLAGVSRRLVEDSHPEQQLAGIRDELILLATAYLQACCRPAPHATVLIQPEAAPAGAPQWT